MRYALGVVLASLFALPISAPSFASNKSGQTDDFPLQVHIVRVDMAQGTTNVSGSGSTDSNGDYSSSVSGGGSYLYHVYTIHVDGSDLEYKMTTPARHFKGGRGLAMATFGVSAAATSRSNYWLRIGNYKGCWNKDGSLEIQFFDKKGKLTHQPFFVRAESSLKPEQPTADKQPDR
jgi:hypothetical protein